MGRIERRHAADARFRYEICCPINDCCATGSVLTASLDTTTRAI